MLCRWGYMLMADPAAALAETRRVLRPGGRVALAVWDALERNPWALLPAQELIARGLALAAPTPTAARTAGPVRAGRAPGASQELLEQAGFVEVARRGARAVRRHASFEELWETTLDLSRSFHDAVLSRPAAEIAEIEAAAAPSASRPTPRPTARSRSRRARSSRRRAPEQRPRKLG